MQEFDWYYDNVGFYMMKNIPCLGALIVMLMSWERKGGCFG